MSTKNSSKFFENKDCEFYPCHDITEINCLFCYCPLYGLECEGDWKITQGVKDCSDCTIPHNPKNYGYMIAKLMELLQEK